MNERLALVIGNSQYRDRRLAGLESPAADVVDLAAVLRSPDMGGFTDVRQLLDEPAATVRREIARFFSADRDRSDLLLLYFSGHGVKNARGELYLAVADTETDLLGATAIPASFISDEMDASPSRRLVLVLDCCHSGAFLGRAKGAAGVSVDTAGAFAGTGSGRVILTATDSTQYAWEGERVSGAAQASMFTRYMVDGLRTGAADLDEDGEITIDELYDFVHRQVVERTPNQRPRKFVLNQEGELVVAHSPRPVELPAGLLAAVRSPFPDTRLQAVAELAGAGWLASRRPGRAQAAARALRELAGDDSRRVAEAARAGLGGQPPAATGPGWEPLPAGPAGPPPAGGTGAGSPAARPAGPPLRERARRALAGRRARLAAWALLPVLALPLLAPLLVAGRGDLARLLPFLAPLAACLVGLSLVVAGRAWRRRLALGLAAALVAVTPSAYAYLAHPAAPLSTRVATPPPPAPQQWESSPLPAPRMEGGAGAANGLLYAVGGFAGPDLRSQDATFVFDGGWHAGPPLPRAVDHVSAAALRDGLYVAGGFVDDGDAVAQVHRLDRTGWHDVPALNHARGALALVAVGDRLYALGGVRRDHGTADVDVAEVYQRGAPAWTDLPPMPHPRNHVAGFTVAGLACVAGGRVNTPPAGYQTTDAVDCYDPAARAWRTPLPRLPVATSGAAAGTAGDELVLVGGEGEALTGVVMRLRLDQPGARWATEPMLVARHGVFLAPYQGRLWACGGSNQTGPSPVADCTSIGA